jgi:hypothetical protein
VLYSFAALGLVEVLGLAGWGPGWSSYIVMGVDLTGAIGWEAKRDDPATGVELGVIEDWQGWGSVSVCAHWLPFAFLASHETWYGWKLAGQLAFWLES